MSKGNLQYERHVPKFLKEYIQANPTPEESNAKRQEARQGGIEDRPDRDDEAPQIANAAEYAFDITNGAVDGIDVVPSSVKALVAAAKAASSADEPERAEPGHELDDVDAAEVVLADPLAAAVVHAAPVVVGRGRGSARVEDAAADAKEAEMGIFVFRKAKKRHADVSVTGAELPAADKKRSDKRLLSFQQDEEDA